MAVDTFLSSGFVSTNPEEPETRQKAKHEHIYTDGTDASEAVAEARGI